MGRQTEPRSTLPAGGVEQYDKASDGLCHGNQVNFVRTIEDLLPRAGTVGSCQDAADAGWNSPGLIRDVGAFPAVR